MTDTDAARYAIDEEDPGFQPPAYYAPGVAELQHPIGADIHRALTYAMPDGYRPLQLDLYVPTDRSGPVPCVVWIHGGAWLFGTRLAPPDYWPAGRLFQGAIDAGLAVASIDYRHSREAPFPAQLHDAKAAIRYLRYFAPQLGIDSARFGVWGESAGGHLAALVALIADPAFEGSEGVVGPSSAVGAVVDFYGVADVDTLPSFFSSMPQEWIEELQAKGDQGAVEPIDVLLAGSAFSREDGRRLVSPVTHAAAGAPPFLLVHGESDALVPIGQSEQLLAALQSAGVEAELVRVAGADHVFLGTDPVPQLDLAITYLRDKLGS
ncbi:alpha/beta hydrolase [Microbacterium pumilum]|uniref:BD-FAE-like domain-containing protein n=1 Tax=Microbacterium pumilum TaxID=344165 RepID=A0ABP5D4I1_9MICO